MDMGTIIVCIVGGIILLTIRFIISSIVNKAGQYVEEAYIEFKNEKGTESESLASLYNNEQQSDGEGREV